MHFQCLQQASGGPCNIRRVLCQGEHCVCIWTKAGIIVLPLLSVGVECMCVCAVCVNGKD